MNDNTAFRPNTSIQFVAEVIAAYLSGNRVEVAELPGLIASVHAALENLSEEKPAAPVGPVTRTAAEIKRSIKHDGIISFEDGKTYKTMKRHLALHGLTPETYRAKWGLPVNYPMTSAAYSAQRSDLARSLGLGQKQRKSHLKVVPAVATGDETISEAPKPRGQPRKAVEAPKAAPKARGRKQVAEIA